MVCSQAPASMLHPLHHTPRPLLAQLLILLYWSERPVAPEGLNSQASDKAGVLAKEQNCTYSQHWINKER